MLKIGLTGNIGSGKTLVSNIFRVLGVPVFHADSEAKKLYLNPEVKQQLIKITGPDILDETGNVDRKKFSAILFKDDALVREVNRFIHPLVRKAFALYSEEHNSMPYSLYEAALLLESGYHRELDRLIVVYAPEELRLARVMERDQVPAEEVMDRARFQLPDEIKIKEADWVIYNDESRLVIPQVLDIDKLIRKLNS